MIADRLVSMYRKTCLARAFELSVIAAHKGGKLPPAPFYLSIGQEHIAAIVSELASSFAVFPQHRGHSWYLSYGGDALALRDELLGLPSGCAGGMGGSASIHWPGARVFGHSGLLGDQAPIGVGYALASGRDTVIVLGDAAVEEDYVLASLGFAKSSGAPVLFVVEDNDRSILTPKSVRRSWDAVSVARSFGLWAIDIDDDPEILVSTINTAIYKLPAFVNIHTSRHCWHAGSGQDNVPHHDRLADLADLLVRYVGTVPNCDGLPGGFWDY